MTRERAISFGPDQALVGIVTLGASRPAGTAPPPLIMFNAGLLHRIGPHRMYVDVARRMADHGRTSLRMDFSGIGDSAARLDGLPATESVISEGQDAMNVLTQATRQQRFVLMGLCSGAYNAFEVARADERVSALVLIDAFPYRTPGYFVRHYGRRFFRLRSWLNLLTGKHPMWDRVRGRHERQHYPVDLPINPLPPRENMEQGLRSLVARGVKLLVIYTAGLAGDYNHRNQFLHTFRGIDFKDLLQLEYLARADHTFTLLEDRAHLLALLERWLLDAIQ